MVWTFLSGHLWVLAGQEGQRNTQQPRHQLLLCPWHKPLPSPLPPKHPFHPPPPPDFGLLHLELKVPHHCWWRFTPLAHVEKREKAYKSSQRRKRQDLSYCLCRSNSKERCFRTYELGGQAGRRQLMASGDNTPGSSASCTQGRPQASWRCLG